MNKLIVGLTPSIIEKLITEPINWNNAKSKIFQHKILVSEIILEYYRSYFIKKDKEELFISYWTNISRYDNFENLKTLEEDFFDELSSQVTQFSHKIVLYAGEDISSFCKDINFIKLEDIDKEHSFDEFSRFCMPFSYILPRNIPSKEIFDWFTDLFVNIKKINIIDPYVLKTKELLKDYYMIIFPSDAVVKIYYDENQTDQIGVITPLKKEFRERITMYSSDPNEMHDRYIFCDEFAINIGCGLDFIDLKTKATRLETNITIFKDKKPTIPKRKVSCS